MRATIIAFVICFLGVSRPLWAQSDVYICKNADGTREFKNTGSTGGCKRVDLLGVSLVKPAGKPWSPPSLKIGLAQDEVLKQWGKPKEKRRRQTREGTSEAWTYPGNRVLVFRNKTLEMIED
jgi:hypothetical protein